MAIFQGIPSYDPITDKITGRVTRNWTKWFSELIGRINETPERVNAPVALTTQGGSIGLTPLELSDSTSGLYRLSYYARITQAATTSSSLEITFAWTDGGIAQTQTFAAITGNTTLTHQSGVYNIRIDSGTAVSYSTTYSSTGATPMQYRLDIAAESISLE